MDLSDSLYVYIRPLVRLWRKTRKKGMKAENKHDCWPPILRASKHPSEVQNYLLT